MWPYVTICNHMWPYVTTCSQVIPNPMTIVTICDHLWPGVAKSATSCGRPKKVNYDQIQLIWAHVTLVSTCDYLWPDDTKSAELWEAQKGNSSSYYSYTSYHFQLHQLPSPVTQTSYFSYVLQLLQLPIPVTQDTQSSCPSYLSYSSYQIPPPSISHRRYS